MARLVGLLRTLSLWLFWPGVAVVVWGELTPNPPQLGGLFGWDKAEHFTAYLGLAGMASLVLGEAPPPARHPRMGALGLAFAGAVLLGGALELLQAVTGRDAEWGDFFANSLGALMGVAIAFMLLKQAAGAAALVGGRARG